MCRLGNARRPEKVGPPSTLLNWVGSVWRANCWLRAGRATKAPVEQNYPFNSDEQFLENWLQFSAFHRARIASHLARSFQTATDEGLRTSILLSCLQEYSQSFEDLGIWAEAIRLHSVGKGNLAPCMDKASVIWPEFFDKLSAATADEYAALYGLPPLSTVAEDQRLEYERTIAAWCQQAHRVASNMLKRTEGNQLLLYRLLNKMKHGMLISALTYDDASVVFVHPEASVPTPGELWGQKVSLDAAEFYAKETYAVSKLLAATLRGWFLWKFGRQPQTFWSDAIGAGVSETTLTGIIEIVRVPSLPPESELSP